MKKLLAVVAVLCLLVPTLALAEGNLSVKAIVTSIDLKTKTLSFKRLNFDGVWEQKVATWNEKTKWADETAGPGKSKPATVALAKTLKEGSKVWLMVTDDVLTSVTALAPTTEF